MRKYLFLLLLALPLLGVAKSDLIPDMKFRRLDTQDGLSSSQINCVFKDSRGFVWIGTPYGLNRYDGYRFRTFYSNIRDTTSMRDNYTEKIFEAFDGKLWLKQGMNYCVYDPVKETFERNASRELEKYGIVGGVERLFIDAKKNFWVKVYDKGIYYYNPTTKKLVNFKSGYGKNEFNPTYGINSLAMLGDKAVFSTNNGELVCLDGEKGSISWENNYMKRNGGPENQDYKLFIDKNNNYWCISLGQVFVYVKKINRWFSTLNEYLSFVQIEGLPEKLEVWDLLIDKKGWIWLATDHEGLIVVDVKNKLFKQFKNDKNDETTISDNTLRNLCQDYDGNIWIGSYKNGLNQYVEGMSSIKSLELGDINTACEDRYGNYWLGTNDQGILVYAPSIGEVVAHYTKDNSGLYGNIMVGSWPAKDGSIWFGSYNGGLSRCIPSKDNPTHATIVNYQATGKPDGLANNNVWALTEDKWNRIWFTTLGSGLQMFDPKTGKFRTWNTQNTKLPSDYMTSVCWTKKGWLMAGTSYYYSLTNPVSMQLLTQSLPEDPAITVNVSNTNYVIEDSRGLIWQGSTSGLTVYDPKSKFITLIDMTKGLYGSGINSIIEDKKRAVWCVTDHGISRIVPQQQEDGSWQFNVRSFNSRDGLQKATYNQRSTWLTHDGKILVGGQGGLDIIDPSTLMEKKSKEHPVFSGLQIFDQDVTVGQEFDGRVILDEALDVCRELSLKFNDQFTIQLGTNEVQINNSRRFAYLLEGFNTDWVKTSKQNPNITYNSLRAGSYVLRVRMLNDDGSIGTEESQLEITIRPPLWRTRWMILLYMILLAFGAWYWRKWFVKKTAERMEIQKLRMETEKRQWMNEVRTQLLSEMGAMQQTQKEDEAVEVIHERDIQDDGSVTSERISGAKSVGLQLHKTTDNLVATLRALCDNYQIPPEKKAKLSFNAVSEAIEIAYDVDQIKRAIDILLSNSLKFSPTGCKIQVTVMQPNPEHAYILVADNGIGIREEYKAHMFDPVIGDNEGIGLDVVKQIVDAHHGTIKAEDNPGGGTVFTIGLPVEDPDIEEAVLIEDE